MSSVKRSSLIEDAIELITVPVHTPSVRKTNSVSVDVSNVDAKISSCMEKIIAARKLYNAETKRLLTTPNVGGLNHKVEIGRLTLNFSPNSYEDYFFTSSVYRAFKNIWFGRVMLTILILISIGQILKSTGSFGSSFRSEGDMGLSNTVFILMIVLIIIAGISTLSTFIYSFFDLNYFNVITVVLMAVGMIKTLLVTTNGTVGLVLYLLVIFFFYRGRYLVSLFQTFYDLLFFNIWQLAYAKTVSLQELLAVDFIQLCYLLIMASASYRYELALRKKFILAMEVVRQQTVSRHVLENIFPAYMVRRIKFRMTFPNYIIASEENCVSVIFVDICHFWEMVTDYGAPHLVSFLDAIYQAFDEMADKFAIQKMETVGKTYLACAGLPGTRLDHALGCAELGLAITQNMNEVGIKVKVGCNSGRVISGVVGLQRPQFSLFGIPLYEYFFYVQGDTVNTASRMGSTGIEGKVQCTESFHDLIKYHFHCTQRSVSAKGKGLLTAYIIEKQVRNSILREVILDLEETSDSEIDKVVDLPVSPPKSVALNYSVVPLVAPNADDKTLMASLDIVAYRFIKFVPLGFVTYEEALKFEFSESQRNSDAELEKVDYIHYSTSDILSFCQNNSIVEDTLTVIPRKSLLGNSENEDFSNMSQNIGEYNVNKFDPDETLEMIFEEHELEHVFEEYKMATIVCVVLSGAQAGFENWIQTSQGYITNKYSFVLRFCVVFLGLLLLIVPFLKPPNKIMYYLKLGFFSIALFISVACPLLNTSGEQHSPNAPHELREYATAGFLFYFACFGNIGLRFRHVFYEALYAIIIWTISLAILSANKARDWNFAFFLCAVLLGITCIVMQSYGRELYKRRSFIMQSLVGLEKTSAEKFLYHMVPHRIARQLAMGRKTEPQMYSDVSILYSDIKGFTQMSSSAPPEDVVSLLSDLFSKFDKLTDIHKVYKVQTIGDAYVVVSGFDFVERGDMVSHAKNCVDMAISMHRKVLEIKTRDGMSIHMRIGVHTGSIVGGCIGTKKIRFDIWGEDALVANLLESSGEVDCVHISQDTFSLVGEIFNCSKNILMDVPNREAPIQTYLIRANSLNEII